ncbi:chaperone GrpE [Candidatus Uzinura diaspidicola str. ASNER]|uniref:Protein GrpE n=1 Tax=Candidatus Uzinura diaspidicola str. ASNER TaxID=1133592 RepID=L7VK75_9FLAO|nr:chaperone GrpE [Candidatus Uzinura diaspidicola str. ASNER]
MNLDKKEPFSYFNESVKRVLERELFKKKIVEQKNKFLRIFSDFENYKKRIQKEKFELVKLANQEVVVELIPVLDDFERCLLEIKKDNNVNIIIGIKLIYEKFFSVLKKKGIKQIKTKKGDHFSTDIHEALSQIKATSQDLKGKIIDIVEMGYLLYDKVVRHAKVIVGK